MADKREEKKKKKERTPGTFAQMKQVYQMTKKSDPNIGWILSLSALGTLLVFLLIGIALGNWITFLILGLEYSRLPKKHHGDRHGLLPHQLGFQV